MPGRRYVHYGTSTRGVWVEKERTCSESPNEVHAQMANVGITNGPTDFAG